MNFGCFIQKTTKISNVVCADETADQVKGAKTENNQCSAPPSDQFSSMKLNEDDHSKLLSSKLSETTKTIKEKMTVKSPTKNRNVLESVICTVRHPIKSVRPISNLTIMLLYLEI